jgi:hypothetical protein
MATHVSVWRAEYLTLHIFLLDVLDGDLLTVEVDLDGGCPLWMTKPDGAMIDLKDYKSKKNQIIYPRMELIS